MNELKPHQLARLAYVVAGLFTVHLITYLIPILRDATPSSSAIVAVLVGILGVAEHLLLFPIVATRIVGWLLALDLFIYSFVVLFPSLVLLPVWFVLVGRLFARGGEQERVYVEKKAMG